LSLRARLLLLAFAAAGPLLVLAVVSERLVSARLEDEAQARLAAAQRAVRALLDQRRAALVEQTEALAREDLNTPLDDLSLATLASALAQRRGLALLDLIDGQGRIISSSLWPAGLGLADPSRAIDPQGRVRWARVAQDFGGVERLALTEERTARFQGQPVLVRAGLLVDEQLLAELRSLMQLEPALIEIGGASSRILPAGSALAAWSDTPRAGSGSIAIGAVPWRYEAQPLATGVLLVLAQDRRPGDRLLAEIRRTTLGAVALALGLGLAAALILAGRLSRPVAELAGAARRVAEGDLDAHVPDGGPGEVGALAQDFATMTEALRGSRARLLQAERVASWREMARRLAHELKNPLFPIQLSIETLRRTLERAGEAPTQQQQREFVALFRESSETILDELLSLRRIIDDFSEFARMPSPQPRAANLNLLVEQARGLYATNVPNVSVVTDLYPDLPALWGDPELLQRALANLIKNAVEAMPEGGTLRLRTRLAPEGLAVEVEDSGPGLDADQRTRLFTPYFTTKRGGTGLGLAIVQGIVSDHGGRIDVWSEPERGTRFTLLLPAAPQPPEAELPAAE